MLHKLKVFYIEFTVLQALLYIILRLLRSIDSKNPCKIWLSYHAITLFFSCDQRSLASYIKKYAWSNAKTEDLWAALEEGSGEPVNKLMTSWTKQKGYPVVSVTVNDQKLQFNQVSLHLDLSFDFYTIMF